MMFRIKILPAITIFLVSTLYVETSVALPEIMVSRMDERIVDDNPPKVADDNSVVVTIPTASPPTASSPTMSSPTASPPSSAPVSGTSPTNSIPIPDPCTDNNDGSFGISSGDGYEIAYLYEMVSLPGSDILNALAGLEAVISNAVLSSSLLSCGTRRKFIRTRRAQGSSIIGISSFPSDSVTENECVVADGTPCHHIDGRMTVYLSENDASVKDSILNIIQNGMTDGTFAASVQDIEELVYIDPNASITDDDETNGVQGPGMTNTGKAAKGGLSTIPLIASGVAALILLGVIAGRRATNKNREFDELEDDNQNEQNQDTDETQDKTEYVVGNDSYLDQTGGSVTVTSCCDVMNTPY